MENMEIRELFEQFLDERLRQVTLSGGLGEGGLVKIKLHPVLLREGLSFQAEEFRGKQVFHKNMERDEAAGYLTGWMAGRGDGVFHQAQVDSACGSAAILVSKKGKVTVKLRRFEERAGQASLSHNRKKAYILEEGVPVPFLVDLGVQTRDGSVVHARYDKFRQINRFLEFIEDVLPKLDQSRELTIVDFGCGKSYLTFAMYHYIKIIKGCRVKIIGLDLKRDVIERCGRLAEKYGYDSLRFYYGDIASFEGVKQVDMVVTLHACDTATDYALEKAVRWGAKAILSVPCCQHELNGQMKNELLDPILQYGIVRERMAALCTDALRAQILEHMGYRAQLLEFIDMEHTPKNILIRAVRQGERKQNTEDIENILKFLSVEPTLYRLLMGKPDQWRIRQRERGNPLQ